MLFSAQCLWDVPRVQSSFILIWSMTEGRISTKAAIALLGAYCGSKRNNHCIELTFVKATELRETVLLCLERISNKKCFSGRKLGLWRHRQMNPNAARIITTTTCNSPPPKKKSPSWGPFAIYSDLQRKIFSFSWIWHDAPIKHLQTMCDSDRSFCEADLWIAFHRTSTWGNTPTQTQPLVLFWISAVFSLNAWQCPWCHELTSHASYMIARYCVGGNTLQKHQLQ